jgi:hypothetical protein
MIFYKLPFGKRELFSVYQLIFLVTFSRKEEKVSVLGGIERICHGFCAVGYADAFFCRDMRGDLGYDILGRFKIGVVACDNAEVGKPRGCLPKLAPALTRAPADRPEYADEPPARVAAQNRKSIQQTHGVVCVIYHAGYILSRAGHGFKPSAHAHGGQSVLRGGKRYAEAAANGKSAKRAPRRKIAGERESDACFFSSVFGLE